MTGARWLARVVARHGSGPHVFAAACRRIRTRVRALPVERCRDLATGGFLAKRDFLRDTIGGWSQSTMDILGFALAERIRTPGVLP